MPSKSSPLRGRSSKRSRGGTASSGHSFAALSSIALNLAEGLATEAGNARLRFETARGSLCEAKAGLRVAVAWGYVTAEASAGASSRLHALGGRVFGLARR